MPSCSVEAARTPRERHRRPMVFVLFVSIALAFAEAGSAEAARSYVYSPPDELADGWAVSSLDAEGIDIETIELLTSRIMDNTYKHIYAMAIVKNGALVHEAYFNGRDRSSRIKTHSITKSVTSMLIGIAVADGKIGGIGDHVLAYLPEYQEYVDDPRKNEITIEHVLTLKTGWKWDEQSVIYDDPKNSHYWMEESDDWLRYVIEQPLEAEPGERHVYCTGAVHLLSGVIKNATGMYVNRYAENVLFEPLGITDYEWITDNRKYPCTGGSNGGLCLRARDLAKIGLLVMRGGEWNGTQVVPREWLEASLEGRFQVGNLQKFGYLWWSGKFKIQGRELDYVQASGYGGQLLHIVPDLDLVIVFQSWSRDEGADLLAPLLMTYKAVLTGSDE